MDMRWFFYALKNITIPHLAIITIEKITSCYHPEGILLVNL